MVSALAQRGDHWPLTMTRPTGATGVGGVAAGSGMLAAACGTDAALALASALAGLEAATAM